MENVYSTVDISVLYGVNLYRVFVCCVKDAPCVDVSAMDSRAHVMRPAVVVVVGVIRCMCMSNWIHNIQWKWHTLLMWKCKYPNTDIGVHCIYRQPRDYHL